MINYSHEYKNMYFCLHLYVNKSYFRNLTTVIELLKTRNIPGKLILNRVIADEYQKKHFLISFFQLQIFYVNVSNEVYDYVQSAVEGHIFDIIQKNAHGSHSSPDQHCSRATSLT